MQVWKVLAPEYSEVLEMMIGNWVNRWDQSPRASKTNRTERSRDDESSARPTRMMEWFMDGCRPMDGAQERTGRDRWRWAGRWRIHMRMKWKKGRETLWSTRRAAKRREEEHNCTECFPPVHAGVAPPTADVLLRVAPLFCRLPCGWEGTRSRSTTRTMWTGSDRGDGAIVWECSQRANEHHQGHTKWDTIKTFDTVGSRWGTSPRVCLTSYTAAGGSWEKNAQERTNWRWRGTMEANTTKLHQRIGELKEEIGRMSRETGRNKREWVEHERKDNAVIFRWRKTRMVTQLTHQGKAVMGSR